MVERNADGTVKSGVLNPTGRNQHTYQLEALDEFAKQLKQELEPGESRLNAAIDRVISDCIAGAPPAQKLVFERILPAVQRHEVDFTDDPEQAQLSDMLAALAVRRRTNGSGRSPDATPAEDAGS